MLHSPPVIKAKLNALKTKLFHDLWAKAIFWRCWRLQNIILHVIYFIVACYCSLKRQKGEGNPQTTTISLNSDIINTVKYGGSVCLSGASSHVTLNILKRLSDLSSDLVAFRRVSTAGTPPPNSHLQDLLWGLPQLLLLNALAFTWIFSSRSSISDSDTGSSDRAAGLCKELVYLLYTLVYCWILLPFFAQVRKSLPQTARDEQVEHHWPLLDIQDWQSSELIRKK